MSATSYRSLNNLCCISFIMKVVPARKCSAACFRSREKDVEINRANIMEMFVKLWQSVFKDPYVSTINVCELF